MGKAQRKIHPALWILAKIIIMLLGFILLRRSGAMSSGAMLKLSGNPAALLAMIGTALTYDFIRGISLFRLLHQTGRPTSLWLCVKAQWIAHFFNFMVPGQAGGLGAKSIYVSQLLAIPWKSALNVLSVELLMGFLALTTFTAVNSFWLALKTTDATIARSCWWFAGISVALTLGIPILLRWARTRGWIREPSTGEEGWRQEIRRASVWLDRRKLCLEIGGLTLITFFMKCLVLWIAARQLEAPPSVDYAAICSSFSLGVMVSLIPVAPGGLVTGNLGFGSALALLTGAPFALGADIYTAIWAVHLALGLLGAVTFLFARRTSIKSGHRPQQ